MQLRHLRLTRCLGTCRKQGLHCTTAHRSCCAQHSATASAAIHTSHLRSAELCCPPASASVPVDRSAAPVALPYLCTTMHRQLSTYVSIARYIYLLNNIISIYRYISICVSVSHSAGESATRMHRGPHARLCIYTCQIASADLPACLNWFDLSEALALP